MLKYIGALLLLIAAGLFSSGKCASAKRQIEETAALAQLVSVTGECIGTFCYPLDRIYADFKNDFLEKTGFSAVLRERGLPAAVCECITEAPPDIRDEVRGFAAQIGGISAEGQVKLCNLVSLRLSKRADEMRADISERLKMYRLLPLLAASSVLLLII